MPVPFCCSAEVVTDSIARHIFTHRVTTYVVCLVCLWMTVHLSVWLLVNWPTCSAPTPFGAQFCSSNKYNYLNSENNVGYQSPVQVPRLTSASLQATFLSTSGEWGGQNLVETVQVARVF